jgi:putative transcriptional regulator
MAQMLRSKNLATKFQILLEIAANQPNIQQRDVARKVGITSQAVSEYIKELIKDGWLSSQGRSRYRVTPQGVDWVVRMSRQLQSYSAFVAKVITDISISAAIADSDLSTGQTVSLYMKDGLLFASATTGDEGARGIAVSGAKKGEDVAISNVEGLISLESGKITLCQVPNVQKGGSRKTNLPLLKSETSQGVLVGAIGIEALVALRRIGIEPDYLYGVGEAAVEAAHRGLPFLIVCVEDGVSMLAQKLDEENLDYQIVDLREAKKSSG